MTRRLRHVQSEFPFSSAYVESLESGEGPDRHWVLLPKKLPKRLPSVGAGPLLPHCHHALP